MSRSDARKNRAAIFKVARMLGEVFEECAEAAFVSIESGSATTGAPGQPVLSGDLKVSWELLFSTPSKAIIGTRSPYARAIEFATGKFGPLHLRSATGGWHSVSLTHKNFDRIIAAVKARHATGTSTTEITAVAAAGVAP